MRLHLVRHGPPEIDRATPAATWSLDPETANEVDRLGDSGVLPTGTAGLWFTSTEPKAAQTAARLHDGSVRPLDELREAERPARWFGREEFVETVTRSLEQPDTAAYDGWETAQSVRVRTFGTLRGEIARAAYALGAEEIVLVGHGTAWTVLVAALTATPPDLASWQEMTMPDHCLIELDIESDDDWATSRPSGGRIVAGWGSWRAS